MSTEDELSQEQYHQEHQQVKEGEEIADDEAEEIEDTTIDFPDVYSSWKQDTTLECDRRLSRAARNFLKEHLLNTVYDFDDDHKLNGKQQNRRGATGEDDSDVWTLLERWLASVPQKRLLRSAKSCPLQLSEEREDVYRNDEMHTKLVHVQSFPGGTIRAMTAAYPNYVMKYRPTATQNYDNRRKNKNHRHEPPNYWYRCGYCEKTFTSQFYLDIHMMTHHHQRHNDHHNDSTHSNMATIICPAIDWCQLIGHANCHERALEDEPYYDRGSNGWAIEDSNSIRHKWYKIAHSIPCHVDIIRNDCRSILIDCGILPPSTTTTTTTTTDGTDGDTNDNDDWTVTSSSYILSAERFCQSLTCPNQRSLWKYFGEEDILDGSRLSPKKAPSGIGDHWKDIWHNEIHHHQRLFSTVGFVVVLALIVWISRVILFSVKESTNTGRRSIPAGQRLLHKRGTQYQGATGSLSSARTSSREEILRYRREKLSNAKRD
jgi:hypothetical protein